ncbi:MAG: type II toxin-antitoxin system HipA family toxin [Gammaproteobacteria bacterium]
MAMYVWMYLPTAATPVPCGALDEVRPGIWRFAYGRQYAARNDAISLCPDFPLDAALRSEWLEPLPGDALPAAVADVGPGRWAEYVLHKRLGRPPRAMEGLLATGPARLGALGFSTALEAPPPVHPGPVLGLSELPALMKAAAWLEDGDVPPAEYRIALEHGPSVGGRRPKADFVDADGGLWIAKFTSRMDRIPDQPRLEAFALSVARDCGIEVPQFHIKIVHGKPVLLLRRFDRDRRHWRIHVLSVRTLLGIPESSIDLDGSYPAIAGLLRRRGRDAEDARRWYERMLFNIAIGNTDDHPLNHLFGWDGKALSLMPAFDIEPCGGRDEGRHQMRVTPDSFIGGYEQALAVHAEFGLTRKQADGSIQRLRKRLKARWPALARAAGCSADALAVIRASLVL